jgi:hypothetical protein
MDAPADKPSESVHPDEVATMALAEALFLQPYQRR